MHKKILVTIGHPAQKSPILPFSLVNTEEGNEIKSAKLLRKEVADNIAHFGFIRGIHFLPSDFYWAIFEDIKAKEPIKASNNWYWRMYKEFTQENIQQMEVMTPVGN